MRRCWAIGACRHQWEPARAGHLDPKLESSLLLILEPSLDKEHQQKVIDQLAAMGVESQLVRSYTQSVVFVMSDVRSLPTHEFSQLSGVRKVVRLSPSCPLTLDEFGNRRVNLNVPSPRDTAGSDGNYNSNRDKTRSAPSGDLNTCGAGTLAIGGGAPPVVIAGPCSVEGRDQILDLAKQLKTSGAHALRGGAFKPRTSPYEFSGLGADALGYLREAGERNALPVVSEVLSEAQIEAAMDTVDMLQIGARNMYNYELLKEVGRSGKPVLLKRGLSATIEEYVQAAEYILLEGNSQVVLCERGIRTFESATRNTLDLSAVPILKSMTGLPVLVDPSHATGKRSLIRSMSRAAIACGADGLLIEVHARPMKSISDAEQAISPAELAQIVDDVRIFSEALRIADGVKTEMVELCGTVGASEKSGDGASVIRQLSAATRKH
jgi:phospho-2-dehydro-3-deoxyheptonate aldolase